MTELTDWPWLCWARRYPQRVALCCGEQGYDWHTLAARIERLAVGFSQQGVRCGSAVVLRGANGETSLLAYLALLKCGARLIPVNPRLPAAQLTAMLCGLDAEFILTAEREIDSYPASRFLPPESETDIALRVLTLAEQAGGIPHPWDPAHIATLTFTSGSGGTPKAVAHRFSAHLASASGVCERLGFTAEESWLLSLPLFHVSGQGILWRWLLMGAGLVLPGELPLSRALENATFASLVPTQLWRVLQQPSLPETLHTVLLGGAAIPASFTSEAEARGIACWCGYGLTETASTVAAKRADGKEGVGLPLHGQRIRINDGQIQIRSAALGCGYWRNGGLIPLTDEEGWFSTRDRGEWRAGEFQVCGRMDNQFFSAGEGIQPEQIEQILLAHPAISQVFIVPREDAEYGHRPVALVATEAATLAEIADWAGSRLAGFQRPVAWYRLPDLSGGGVKISRKRLMAWVALCESGSNGGSGPGE